MVRVRLINGQVLEYDTMSWARYNREEKVLHLSRKEPDMKKPEAGDVWVIDGRMVVEFSDKPSKMYNTITFPDAVVNQLTGVTEHG